ncbi:MAG: hypothetical protein IPJ88_11295 [Myxococcales bacterium]|nr:MAG: hypothetical protein IPJ88_11295 [Myxococcales bacterium]
MLGETGIGATLPRGFPQTQDYLPLGTASVSVDWARTRYRFNALGHEEAALIEQRYGDLSKHKDTATPPIDITLRLMDASLFTTIEPSGWQYAIELQQTQDTVWCMGWQWMAKIEKNHGLRSTVWTSRRHDRFFLDPIDNIFRILCCYQFCKQGGVVLHSAGVENDGQAYIFFGPSGAGKSTLCGISEKQGYNILSDELNALLPSRDGWTVCPLPFAGDFGRTIAEDRARPLKGIYRIIQDPDGFLSAMPRGQALATLVAASPYVNHDQTILDRLIENLNDLTTHKPVKRLGFALNPSFWQRLL